MSRTKVPGEIVETRPIGESIGVWGLDEHGQWWNYPYGLDGTRKRAEEFACVECGAMFLRPSTRSPHHLGLFCSRTCSNKSAKAGRTRRKDDHPNWRGGRHVRKRDGYVTIHTRDADDKVKWQLEHRLVMEQHLGRPLYDYETVHHKNGDRADNRIENLELRVGRHGKGASEAHCPTCTCFH